MDRRTYTMNWDGLGDDDDDDSFFESRDRLSSAIPLDLASSGSDDDGDEFEDSRLSFVSTMSSASIKKFKGIEIEAVSSADSFTSMDYDMWMAEPGDIKERRKRLLQGMGLSSNKDLLKLKSAKILRAFSRKVDRCKNPKPPKADTSPDRKVVDWTDLHEMVTATCFTPDGQGALIGSHKGSCRVYDTTECKLEQKENIEIRPKKNSQLKKVTGLQFAPWNPTEVLITSADSRIRIFDGPDMIYKFRAAGFRNTSSQIAASFSSDGKYVISASEDSHVYIWKREEPKTTSSVKRKTSISVQAHERFPCKDVSVAIPWPGSIKNEPPLVELHSKRHSKRFLPTVGSPTKENSGIAHSKRHLPPLPNKNHAFERVASSREEEDLAQLSRTDSGFGPSESFASGSSSARYGDSPSISASSSGRSQSWSSSWTQDGGNSNASTTVQATAWGMVIVTASLGGEIRVYQNFGLPLKASRQTNLFRDPFL